MLKLFQHKTTFIILTEFWDPSCSDNRVKVPLLWRDPGTSEVISLTCIVWPTDCYIVYQSYFSYNCSLEFTAL